METCCHNILDLQTACENFTKFTTLAQLGTKMNCSDFEVKRSKVKVLVRQNLIFWWRHTNCWFAVEYHLVTNF